MKIFAGLRRAKIKSIKDSFEIIKIEGGGYSKHSASRRERQKL